jgi:hypothetical protein
VDEHELTGLYAGQGLRVAQAAARLKISHPRLAGVLERHHLPGHRGRRPQIAAGDEQTERQITGLHAGGQSLREAGAPLAGPGPGPGG